MNTSGEAADQVVRMSLEVGEAALKISGAGAKQLAVLLYAILKEQKKTRGRARLETLVRSGRPLTVFSVKESDLRKFVQEAKRYGILYCAVRNPRGSSDGMVDIMVKEEDAPRINRIVERFQFATVTEAAQIKTEIEKSREQKAKTVGEERTGVKKSGQSQDVPERTGREKSDTDQLMEELMGAPSKKEETQPRNPSLAKTEKSLLSEPISERHSRTAEGTSNLYMPTAPKKKSVREELREIQAGRNQKKRNQPVSDRVQQRGRRQQERVLEHRQPQNRKVKKTSKER